MQQPPRGLSLAASGNENAGLNLFVRSGGLVRVDNARRINANVFCTATYPPGRSRGFFFVHSERRGNAASGTSPREAC